MAEPESGVGAIPGIAGLVEKALARLNPTSPETKGLEIFCPEDRARVSIHIRASPLIKKLNRVVSIPSKGVRSIDLRSLTNFDDLSALVDLEGNEYRIHLGNLPGSDESAVLVVDYDIPTPKAISAIAYSESKADIIGTEEKDRYWMYAGLKDPDALERAYGKVNLRDFSVSINVGIFEKVLAAIPRSLVLRFAALKGALGEHERQRRLKLLLQYNAARTSASKTDDLSAMAALREVFTTEPFRRFVTVDRPFFYERAQPNQFAQGPASLFELPKFVTVESRVSLHRKQEAAESYLYYSAGQLRDHIEDMLGTQDRWKRKLSELPSDAVLPPDSPTGESSPGDDPT